MPIFILPFLLSILLSRPREDNSVSFATSSSPAKRLSYSNLNSYINWNGQV